MANSFAITYSANKLYYINQLTQKIQNTFDKPNTDTYYFEIKSNKNRHFVYDYDEIVRLSLFKLKNRYRDIYFTSTIIKDKVSKEKISNNYSLCCVSKPVTKIVHNTYITYKCTIYKNYHESSSSSLTS